MKILNSWFGKLFPTNWRWGKRHLRQCLWVCVNACECVRDCVWVRARLCVVEFDSVWVWKCVCEFETFSPLREASNVICHCPSRAKKNSHKFLSPLRHLLKSHDARKKAFQKIWKISFSVKEFKMSPWLNIANMFTQSFYACAKIPKVRKDIQVIDVFLLKKAACKMSVKLTKGAKKVILGSIL